jgi:hypothetical protein
MRGGIDASVWIWDLQDVADLLRRVAGSMNEVDRAQASLHVQMLQRTVDAMTLDSHLQSRRAFDMEFLVKCIVTGGFLRNASDFRESLEHSLSICVHDRRLRGFLQEQMQTLRTPSSTSMYRHRLTLHQGFPQLRRRSGEVGHTRFFSSRRLGLAAERSHHHESFSVGVCFWGCQ